MKLAILLDYKHPRMLFLALPPHGKVRKLDIQSEFSMSKIIRIFCSFKKKTLLLKLGPIFDEVAKLGKATQDTYNWEEWLIL